MLIIYGTRNAGVVDRCGATYLSTRFFHIYWMPLIPLGTQLVLDEPGGRAVSVGLSGRSVLAAYLRSWGVVAALAFGAAALGGVEDFADDPIAVLVPAALALASVLGVALSWAVLGRLSAEEKARQLAYETRVGFPVDAALLGDARMELRGRLFADVVERARPFAAVGYREAMDPTRDWARIAAAPETNDKQLVHSALTLARIEWSLTSGAERAQWESQHRAIWQQMKALEPGLVEAVSQTTG